MVWAPVWARGRGAGIWRQLLGYSAERATSAPRAVASGIIRQCATVWLGPAAPMCLRTSRCSATAEPLISLVRLLKRGDS